MERRCRAAGAATSAAVCHRPGVSPPGDRVGQQRRGEANAKASAAADRPARRRRHGGVACGRIGRAYHANAPTAKGAPSGTVTLNGWQVSPAEETKLNKVVHDFEATHPKIHVNYQSITGDYQAQELAKFAARKPPDVLYVDVADIRDWVGQGVLQPLDSFVKATKFNTKPFYKNLLNAFKVGGHFYGFPKDWSSLGMEVNTTLLGNNPVPKTWAQLRKVASRINVPGGKPICLSADW